MTMKEALDFLGSYSLLDGTDIAQDNLREALSVLANRPTRPWYRSKIDDVYHNLSRALNTAREVPGIS
jgi:hypothetical protein